MVAMVFCGGSTRQRNVCRTPLVNNRTDVCMALKPFGREEFVHTHEKSVIVHMHNERTNE